MVRVLEPAGADERSASTAAVPDWAVVDLFCGIGGLSHGLRHAGFNVVAGVDADETCRYAFETNNNATFVGRPLEDVSGDEIAAMFPEGTRRIVVGCAPCTPFSAYSAGPGEARDKWSLVDLFMDRIAAVEPEVISMENVPRLKSFKQRRVFNRFLERLDGVGYEVSAKVVNAADYGVPQDRSRLVVLASKLGPIDVPAATVNTRPTVREAIAHLPALDAGAVDAEDRIHRAPRLSSLNLRRIRAAKPGRPWSEWADQGLLSPCHRRSTGASYKNVYGRMEWDKPSPTLTTGCFSFGRGRFGHPKQDRAISLREAALLQSFPARYEFIAADDPVWFARVGRHIGNAVPVALAAAIGDTIRTHIREHAA
ncbi:DNA cytosine methyltransferase [Candidatus Palauibacter sp.]|uniref:DNA cytosine methyltransferase n=1 Tax=Candidatus Palauibacter sp. TaxID=3101350 RepID=UPI003B5D0080